MEWKYRAKDLYFTEHKKITEIAKLLNKDRKTISTFLSSQEGFKGEKERKKTENEEKRGGYKKNWENKNRKSGSLGEFEKSILKRQHEIDVMILSADKYSI